jgi:hypothetical protein
MDGRAPPSGFAGRWVFACVAGFAVGVPLATALNLWVLPPAMVAEAPRLDTLMLLVRALAGAIVGGTLGAAQVWALRPAYPGLPAAAWIGATAAAGYVVAVMSGLVMPILLRHAGSFSLAAFAMASVVLHGVLGGLVFGFGQARVLAGVTGSPGAWPLRVTLGMTLGTLFTSLVWYLLGVGGDPAMILGGAAFSGAVRGLVLGLATAGTVGLMPPLPGPRSPP